MSKINFEIEEAEIKTPTDGRTWQRKWLIERTREVTQCKYYSHFGFFTWLRYKDIKLVENYLKNLN